MYCIVRYTINCAIDLRTFVESFIHIGDNTKSVRKRIALAEGQVNIEHNEFRRLIYSLTGFLAKANENYPKNIRSYSNWVWRKEKRLRGA